MKLHLPKLLLTAVMAVCSVADAAVTTANSISVGGTTYTGNVSIMGGTGDLNADNLKGVDYMVITGNRSEVNHSTVLSTTVTDAESGEQVISAPTIVIGKYKAPADGQEVTPGQLFVNVWNKQTAVLHNDFILGSYSTTEEGGALRLHESKADKKIILKGDITLAENSVISVSGGDGDGKHNYLEGFISASGKTLTLQHHGSKSSRVVMSGGAEIGTLAGGIKEVTFSALKSDGTTAASNTNYTIDNLTTTGIVTIDSGVSLTIGSTINSGTLNILSKEITVGEGEAASTETVRGKLVVESWAGFDGSLDLTGVEEITENGLITSTGTFTVLGSNASLADGSYDKYWYKGNEYSITAGYNGDVNIYVVAQGDVVVGATGTNDADFYALNGGTLKLEEGSLSKSAVKYFSGSVNLAEGTSCTGLTSLNDMDLIASIGGAGTIEVTGAAHWVNNNDYSGPDIAKKIEAAEGFTGTLYVKSGKFTYSDDRHGSVLKLGNGAHMQVNNGGELTNSLVLESGNHEVHVNGQTKFNVTGSISGDGTFDKRGGSSEVYLKESATVQNYKNSAGTTWVQDNASVTYLRNAGGTVNISGGTHGTIDARGGETKITGTTSSDRLYVGMGGSAIISGAITTGQLRMSEQDGSGNFNESTLTIKSGGSLTITGSTNNNETSRSLLLQHWGNSSKLLQEGGELTATNAVMYTGWAGGGTGTYEITGGTATLKGISFLAQSGRRGVFKLGTAGDASTARVNLGSNGIAEASGNNVTIQLGNGILGATADWTMGYASGQNSANVQLIGTNGGTVFNTENANTPGTGHTITVNTTMSGAGSMVKAGVGTLQLNAANTYSGGTDINAGTVKTGNDSALGTGAVSVATDASLELGDSLTVSSDLTIAEGGSLIFGNGTTLTVTGTLTLTSANDIKLAEGFTFSSADEVKLATGTLALGEGFDATTWAGAGTYTIEGVKYTSSLKAEGDAISVTFKQMVEAPGEPISVTGWDLNGTALTLNVNAALSEGMEVSVHLLGDEMMKDILTKLDEENYRDGKPMVTITLQGTSGIITADKMNEVVFVKGDTGQNYWGEMVDGVGLMYNVERIPEPTTATLSLLALMGLAARRRRK